MIELVERCEKATGPDLTLDAAIEKVVGAEHYTTALLSVTLCYTASLDAAMTLVPEGWSIVVGTYGEQRMPFARLFPPDYANSPLEHQESNDCANMAIALCAAALRSRSTITSETKEG
jgi:hypothetical protein